MSSTLAAGPRGLLLPGHVGNTPPSAFAVPNGLVGYWGFDADCLDFTQGLAFDLSGNGNTGTFTASPTLAQGQVGQALLFDGSTQYVTATTPLVSLVNGTVAIWINPNWSSSDSVDHVFFGAGTNVGNNFFRGEKYLDN